jgi:AraC-like DNA-binding protein
MRERLGLPKSADGALWHYARAQSTGVLKPHTHRELEFNLVTRGTAAYLIQGTKVFLTPGLLIWLFPNQLHLLVDQSPDFQMWIGVFNPRIVNRIAQSSTHAPLKSLDPGQVLARRIAPEPAARITTLCNWYDRTTQPALATMNAGIALILAECWTAYQNAADTTDPALRCQLHPSVQKCIQHLLESPESLKIQALAAHCGVASGTLSRLFKRDTGMSLAAFRNTHRLELFFQRWNSPARENAPKQNLLETALASGFGSYPQFHRVFKQLTGKSPSSLKR